MAKNLTVNGITYSYPETGDDPGWGGDASNWAEEVTEVLNDLNPEGSITQTEINLLDGTSGSYENITGLVFDSANIRSAIIEYVSIRGTETEVGQLYISYNAPNWSISRESNNGDTGLDIQINESTGQLEYKTSTTGIAPNIKFRAKTILNQ